MSENSIQATDATNETNNYLPPVVIKWIFKNPFEGRLDRVPLSPCTSTFAYGPFSIGKTQWLLEYRLPSNKFWLKCVGSDLNTDEEELSFQFTYKQNERKNSFIFNYVGQELQIFDANRRICLSRAAYEFKFEVFVRPHNYMCGLPCDFRVVVLDKNDEEMEIAEYAAHRVILSEGSPVFEAMLAPDSNFKEAKEGVLRIGNFSPEVVRLLLVYAYTKNENIVDGKPYSETIELLDAAEQYQIDGTLKTQCCFRLLELIDCGNAVQLLASAERYHWNPEQKQEVMEFIHDNRCWIIQPDTNDEALKRLSFETLFELLKVFSQQQQ